MKITTHSQIIKTEISSESMLGKDSTLSALRDQVLKAIQLLRDKGLMVGFAESCTGGLFSSLLTAEPGVSDILWGSVVCYSNESKNTLLHVENAVFQRFGAVSSQCATQMSEGLLKVINMQTGTLAGLQTGVQASRKKYLTVALTGIAGPNGGSPSKPVGTVFIAISGTAIATHVYHHEFVMIKGDRVMIQAAAVKAALEHIEQILSET